MSTDRLGELREQALPFTIECIRRADEADEAEFRKRAIQTFDRLFTKAEFLHQDKHQDDDEHRAMLSNIFVEGAKIPGLLALKIVDEFIIKKTPTG